MCNVSVNVLLWLFLLIMIAKPYLINLFLFQPILVFMSKVDGKFKFSPISVNFLTEAVKVLFAIVMLLIQVLHPFMLQWML